MPKNHKKAVGKTVLFVLLTVSLLLGDGFLKEKPLYSGDLTGFVKEVIAWIVPVR
jgi:hypothetical protein